MSPSESKSIQEEVRIDIAEEAKYTGMAKELEQHQERRVPDLLENEEEEIIPRGPQRRQSRIMQIAQISRKSIAAVFEKTIELKDRASACLIWTKECCIGTAVHCWWSAEVLRKTILCDWGRDCNDDREPDSCCYLCCDLCCTPSSPEGHPSGCCFICYCPITCVVVLCGELADCDFYMCRKKFVSVGRDREREELSFHEEVEAGM